MVLKMLEVLEERVLLLYPLVLLVVMEQLVQFQEQDILQEEVVVHQMQTQLNLQEVPVELVAVVKEVLEVVQQQDQVLQILVVVEVVEEIQVHPVVVVLV